MPLDQEEILNSFTDAIILADRFARVTFINAAAEELFSTSRDRAVGSSCRTLFAGNEVLAEVVDRVAREGHAEVHAEQELDLRGHRVPARVSCLPLLSPRGRVRGTATVVHNLTLAQALEESARRDEALASIGTMAAGLAHEIRNPLSAIGGAAQLLGQRLSQQPELREYTDVICREAARLSALLDDLLRFGAPPKPDLAPVNIHRVCHEVLLLLEPELERREIACRQEFDPSLPDVLADERQLTQVVLNLLRNAIRACAELTTSEARCIEIRTRLETAFHIRRGSDRQRKLARLEIADTGTGVDPAVAERLFEPFFTTRPDGTGLGLALSNRIIAQHGGSIRIAPNRPRGTVVTVTLPVA